MSRTIRNIKHAGWLRKPRTFPEHRDSEACKVDGIKKRPKRNKSNLPSAWEDIHVAANYEVPKTKNKKFDVSAYYMYW